MAYKIILNNLYLKPQSWLLVLSAAAFMRQVFKPC